MVIAEQNINNLEDDALLLAEKIFGAKPSEVKRIMRGIMTFKYSVLFSNSDQYIIRFYPAERSNVVEYEPDVIKECSRNGIPAPQVITDSRSGPNTSLNYVIYKMIKGTVMSDLLPKLSTEDYNLISRQLVKFIHNLWDIRIDGYGDLINGLKARNRSWDSFFIESFTEGIKVARRYGLIDEKLLTSIEVLFNNSKEIQTEIKSRLTWGDISPENIILDEDKNIAGIIDFEGVISGDILLNLGYSYAGHYDTKFFQSLLNAWPEKLTKNDWRRIKTYCIIRVLRIARYAHRPLPTGHHREQLTQFLPGFMPGLMSLISN